MGGVRSGARARGGARGRHYGKVGMTATVFTKRGRTQVSELTATPPDPFAHGGAAARRVIALSGGVHRPSTCASLAADLAAATCEAAAQRGLDVDIVMVEIRDYAADVARAGVGDGVAPALAELIATVTEADGLIAVTPVFAASYAGIFKAFFDVLAPESLAGVPTVIGATGGSVRHSLVLDVGLRPLLAYFRADVVPTGVFVGPEDTNDADRHSRLEQRIARAGTELAAALTAPRPVRTAVTTEGWQRNLS